MIQGIDTIEFTLLCCIQIFTIGISLIIFINSFRRYLSINPSELLLRKSVKYFTLIFVTVTVAGIFSLFSNFFYIFTHDGIIAGYIYAVVTSVIILNVFCAWQFITYLILPERRITKYPIGIYCIIGMILIWFFAPTVTNVLYTPNLKNNFLYVYLWSIFTFVWSVFAYEFIRYSMKVSEKKEKYRFRCIGASGIFAVLMFPMAFFGQIFSWLIILNSIVALYLGYNFPKFFQRILKV
ncbi:MAG: hypothetical protein ACTSYB_14580 [Candidatus Helarchaeota archaeon]